MTKQEVTYQAAGVDTAEGARAEEVEAALAEAGEKTYRVGRIVSGTGEVQYTGEGNLYGYQG